MPKDNEVEEKVTPVAWQWLDTSNFRKNIPSAAIREHWNPLYSAATVAELRAEVESERKLRLRAEGLCSQWITRHDFALESLNELTADRNAQRDRADAAERRVGELEKLMAAARRAIGDHHAPNDCYATGPLTGDAFLDLVQCPACAFLEQNEALTGDDPT